MIAKEILAHVTKGELDKIFDAVVFTDFNGRRKHALVGFRDYSYSFTNNKTQTLKTQTEPSIVRAVFKWADRALAAMPLPRNFEFAASHCLLTAYERGNAIGVHDDSDLKNRHNNVLSLSFGHKAIVGIANAKFDVGHGDAILFSGLSPHFVLPLRGCWRYNLSFRAWL